MRTTIIRLAELLLTSITLSLISNIIHLSNFYNTEDDFFSIVLLAAFIIFVISNIHMLCKCYYALPTPKRYYIHNFSAYLIFILITVLVYFIFGKVAYAWLFNIFKVVFFCAAKWSVAASAILSHIAMLAAIVLVPIGMDWRYKYYQL